MLNNTSERLTFESEKRGEDGLRCNQTGIRSIWNSGVVEDKTKGAGEERENGKRGNSKVRPEYMYTRYSLMMMIETWSVKGVKRTRHSEIETK